MNAWDGRPRESARRCFVCAHTVHVDADEALWILDPANPGHAGVVEGGAKLVQVNLSMDQVERVYPFGEDVAPRGSYLNKVRFARGRERVALGVRTVDRK